ncbi:MAG: hypothetical protein ACRDK3_09185 [Actinomycetota bacterium]
MAESNDRIEEALAAYLDQIEMGGPKPDVSHLSPSEQGELDELIRLLELTGGVALGLGRSEEAAGQKAPPPDDASKPIADLVRPELGERVLAQLRETLPPEVRITPDTSAFIARLGGVNIVGGWLVGTFGGRIRVWLLDADDAEQLKGNDDCLDDLAREFRMFPDTAAIAITAKDSTCLLVEPEDCAPHIQGPSGTLVGRRYRRPIQPVAEAVAAFLHELIPYWDPVPAFAQAEGFSIDVTTISERAATAAIESQRGIGDRARKTNPKRAALLELGKREVAALTKMVAGLYDGSVDPDDVGPRLSRLAQR